MTALGELAIPPVGPRRAPRLAAVRNLKVAAGLAILVLFGLLTVAQPLLEATVWQNRLNVYDPQFGFDSSIAHPSAPSAAHWLGTSSLGRDVFSMFIFAARPTLLVAGAAASSIALVALVLGSLAAYRRGWVDGFVSHLSDAMVLLPAMVAVFVLGISRSNEEFGALHVGLTFGVLYGLGPAVATVRAAGMTVVARPFMDAARVAGGGGGWIVTRHVLPHLYAHAAVQAMIGATGAVIADAFLSFAARSARTSASGRWCTTASCGPSSWPAWPIRRGGSCSPASAASPSSPPPSISSASGCARRSTRGSGSGRPRSARPSGGSGVTPRSRW